MSKISILTSSNDPCSLYAKGFLLSYLKKACPSFEEEKPEKTFLLALAKDCPEYKEQAKSTLQHDGFSYFKKEGKHVFLASSPRGLLYSVVTYLQDDLGFRFYIEDEEYIPSLSEISDPKERVVNPPFAMRNYLVGKTYDDNRESGYFTPKQDNFIKTRALDVYTSLDESHGGSAPVYGRNISHNFRLYCPFEIYGETHPEFYQDIVSGSTPMKAIDITSGLKDEDGSLDESKEASVVKAVIEEMKKDIVSHPDCTYFSLTQEDGDQYFNDDHNRELEKKYKRSGLLIRFCNAVIRAVHPWAKKALGRDVKLVTFAYDYASEAPVKEEGGKIVPIDNSVLADENLIIQMALFGNMCHSYFSPDQLDSVKKKLKEWKAIGKRFWFWGYDMDFANYYAYIDSFHIIKQNVLGFFEAGFEYLLIQGCHDESHNWQANLRSYVYTRLMWDLSLEPLDLIKEYLEAYYGPASNKVAKFISLYHEHYQALIQEGKDLRFATWGNPIYPENLPLEVVSLGLSLLENGIKDIESSGLSEERKLTLKKRVYGVMTTPLNALYLNFKEYYPDKPISERDIIKERFRSACLASGATQARETFSIDKYLAFVESEDYEIRPIYENGDWHPRNIKKGA